MRIRYYCHFGKLTGYGRAARDYLAALAGVGGVELEIVSVSGGLSPEPRYRHLDHLVVAQEVPVGLAEPDVAVYHLPPRTLALADWPEKASTRAVALTTWETSACPVEFTLPIQNRYDKVIVPSAFCRDALVADQHYGIPLDDIAVVPHTFDPDFWVPPPATPPPARTRFYTIGAWGERKNALGVLKAYLHAFSRGDPVSLVMLMVGDGDLDEIRSLLARSALPAAELPELTVPDPAVPLTEAQLLDLHAGGHCYVSTARGEGWGLGMFEAAVMGRAVIAPLCGGQMDFLSGYESAYSVPFVHTPCFGSEVRDRVTEMGGGFAQVRAHVQIPPGVTCKQTWAEPDLHETAELMRHVHHDLAQAHGWPVDPFAAATARSRLVARFGYNQVGPHLLKEITE